MIDQTLQSLPKYYLNIMIDNYIVMPNHVHIIIQIVGAGSSRPESIYPYHDTNNNVTINGRDNRAPTLGQIIAYFKYNSTKQINVFKNNGINKIWQRNYHDHVIRNDKSLHQIREYIVNNPKTWDNDEHNLNKKSHNNSLHADRYPRRSRVACTGR